MEQENVKTVAEYFESVYRRKELLLIVFLTVGFLSFVLAMKLPPVFRSYATILIEDQQIPRTMVETTITDFADKRIELIKQRVMTRDRILSIIQKHKLYLEERNKLVPSELVKQFQEDAEISMISADVLDPQRGAGKATIAFTIAFNDGNPLLAQAVANELVSLFLNENTRTRTQRAAKTTDFLKEEANKLKKEIEGFETQIMDFKAKHGNSLPEMLPTNLAALDRAGEALRQTDSDIRIARDRIAYLGESLYQAKQELPAPQAGKPLNRDEQLRLLKAEYIHLSSLYTARHPDTLRVKRQIENLDPEFSGEPDREDIRRQLDDAETELARLRDKYAENHPDVLTQRQLVANLARQAEQASTSQAIGEEPLAEGSAHYVSLVGQLRTSEHELAHLQKLKEEFRTRIEQLQSDIDRTPLVEKEYQELLRMRQASINKFAELEAKYREAKLAQTLEEEQKGETFTIIEPPIAPDKPDKPNRKKIIVMGLGMGLALGLALTALLEMLHEVVRGPKALERLTGLQPIVVIPYIDNPQDVVRRKKRTKAIWSLSLLTMIAAVVLTHFFVMPLEHIWAKALFKLGRL